jgi:type IV secretion system protein VirB1
MSVLTIGSALAIALACSPQAGPNQPAVSPDVLLSVAYTESGLDPFAIHDNATGATLNPKTRQDAAAIASHLIAAGHRPDLGLMQINAPANLTRMGLTVAAAFDPCASIRVGAQVLLDAYAGGATTLAQRVAILQALSTYNTGSQTAGLQTYVPAVLASAQKIIPALRTVGLLPDSVPTISAPSGRTACDGADTLHIAANRSPCSGDAFGVARHALPLGIGETAAPRDVFLRPVGGERELVFNGN